MLQELKNKELRRLELKETVWTLERQLPQMEKDLFALYIEKHNTDADYQNLQSFSLTNLFLAVFGKKEAKLEEARRLAQAAKVKHDTAERNVQWHKEQLVKSREELETLRGITAQYLRALENSGEIQLLKEQTKRTKEELETALERCIQAATDTQRILGHVENLHDQNRSGINHANSMIANQMAATQVRFDWIVRELELFVEQVSNLGLEQQILPWDTILATKDERKWFEALSPMTRDEILGQARRVLKSALERISQIRAELEQKISGLE